MRHRRRPDRQPAPRRGRNHPRARRSSTRRCATARRAEAALLRHHGVSARHRGRAAARLRGGRSRRHAVGRASPTSPGTGSTRATRAELAPAPELPGALREAYQLADGGMAAADARRIREHRSRASTCRSSRATRGTRRADVREMLRAAARQAAWRWCRSAATGANDIDLARLDCLDHVRRGADA